MNLPTLIESILFYLAEPIKIARLAALVHRPLGEVDSAITELEGALESRGIRLIRNRDEVTLGTAPDAGPLIEAMTIEELSKELSKAAVETLAIVLYKGPISRSEIDYIRGVNSQFIIRHLEVRGLIEKEQSSEDARVFLYRSR